jgi:ferric-dicitrate binding protein FerR (iron transport regulator)
VRIEQSDATGNRIGDVELKPNQQAVFIKESNILNIKEIVADNSGSWRRERLVFDEALIGDVILQMERWFNIRIHFEDKANMNCRLTASIEDESLEDVLKLMAASHNIHYRISGTDVFIKGNMCGNSD